MQNYDGLEKTCETRRAASRVSETTSSAQAMLRNGGRKPQQHKTSRFDRCRTIFWRGFFRGPRFSQG